MEYRPLPPMIPISACGNQSSRSAARHSVKLVIIQDGNSGPHGRQLRGARDATIWRMRFLTAGCLLLALSGAGRAQEKSANQAELKSVTVPALIDHNRVVINADVRLPDGSARAGSGLGRQWQSRSGSFTAAGDGAGAASRLRQARMLFARSHEIVMGGMSIPFSGIKEAKIPLKPVNAAAVLAPGMNAEINLPSSLLRHYDVLIDFPDHKFSIGSPGTIHFHGSAGKVQVNAENGLIQVPSQD